MTEPSLARRMFAPFGRLLQFSGRSAPADFWPYMLVLVAIYIAGFAFVFATRPYGFGSTVADQFGLTLVLILLAFAAVVRRLHDVGWSGWWMAAYVLMAFAFIAFFFYWRYGLTHTPLDSQGPSLFRFMPLLTLFSAAMNGTGLLIFVLCLLPGKDSSNGYGPDLKGGSIS